MEVREGYKKTEVGIIPEDWECIEFGYCVISSRLGGNYANDVTPSQFPLIKMGNIGRGNIILEKIEYVKNEVPDEKDRLNNGDLLFNTRNTLELVGKVAIWRNELSKAYYNSNLLHFVFDESYVASSFFINYMFNSKLIIDKLREIATGTTSVAAIYSRDLYKIIIPIPLLPEQQAIADALSDVDGLISSLTKLIDKKKNIKHGSMQEMLTGKKRLEEFSEEWAKKPLSELFDFSGGYSASRAQLSAEGYCYLHYGDIHGSNKQFIDVEKEYLGIPKLDIQLSKVNKEKMLQDGDVVFVDASEDLKGASRHIVVINPNSIPYISGLHTIVAKNKKDILDNKFKRYCFQSDDIKKQFRFYAVGIKVSGLSRNTIAKIEIYFPISKNEQTAIANILSDMDAEIEALEQKLNKYKSIKQGMMQELLTGRIRLV